MKNNYHSHTYRCGHAAGRDEDYVLSAIRNGFNTIGFTDHVMVPGIEDDFGMRGGYSEFQGYLDSVNSLKEKYKDQINVIVGIESEYYDGLHGFLERVLEELRDTLSK